MSEIKVNEVLNNSLNWKFYVLAHEINDIEAFVGGYITINVGEMKINGKLNSVKSWARKERGTIIGIYKELNMTIASIQGETLFLPDKKHLIQEDFSITTKVE